MKEHIFAYITQLYREIRNERCVYLSIWNTQTMKLPKKIQEKNKEH